MEAKVQKKLKILLVILASVLLPVSFSSQNQASALGDSLAIHEDVANGYVTVETNTIKAVWHYKTIAVDNYNQGGGNLYELYYKPMDPSQSYNLVSYIKYGYPTSTNIWAGIGGVGSTDLYAADIKPGADQNNNFTDLISDNNLSGVLQSHSASIDSQGDAVLTFTYKVHNQTTGKEWYEVTKTWTVEPAGTIHLQVSRSLLSSGYFSELAVRDNWNYNLGWDRFVKYGRGWAESSNSPRYLLGSTGIADETAQCWDQLNQFQPDWAAFTGSTKAPTVIMSADNNGEGFRGSGSYQIGMKAWGTSADPMEEQCSILGGMAGSQIISWMAWWSGNPPQGNRYRWLPAGTSWTDTYRIDLAQSIPNVGPDISSVSTQVQGSNLANIAWNTNIIANSVVEIKSNGGNWTVDKYDDSMTNIHSLQLNDLKSGTTYEIRIKSSDSQGNLAESGDYQITTPGNATIRSATGLNLTEQSTGWANLSDYMDGKLSVDFQLTNNSQATVHSVNIGSIVNSNGVETETDLPLGLGDLAGGSSKAFTVFYKVPPGVSQFLTYFGDVASN